MEFFALIFIIWIIVAVIQAVAKGFSSDDGANGQNIAAQENSLFSCIVESGKFELDNGETLPTFDIKIGGTVSGPFDNFPFFFVVELFELTKDDQMLPVLCSNEEMRSSESSFFTWVSNTEEMPYANTAFNDNVEILKVPKGFLTFSRKGRLKLLFRVLIVEPTNNSLLAEASFTKTYQNKELGYHDMMANQEKTEELAIKMSVLLAAVDGDFDSKEANLIKSWIKRRVKEFSDDTQKENKARLNQYVKDVYHIRSTPDIYEEINRLCQESKDLSKANKFDILDLMLQVAGADGKTSKDELKMLNDVSHLLGVDQKIFRDLRDKMLPLHTHEIASSSSIEDLDHLLGINDSLSTEEKKKHLNAEYRKWNARTNSSDEKVRTQAREMIRKISHYRNTLAKNT